MKLLKRIVLILVVFIAIGYVSISWVLSNRILKPNATHETTVEKIKIYWNTTYETLMDPLPSPSDFSVNSFDGLILKGKYFNMSDTSNCAIIMAHGWGVTWVNMLKYIPAISECGCDIFMYDHRAHGESGGDFGTGGINESKDLIAVTEWVQKEYEFNDDQIGWFGSSWGAAAALTAGAEEKNVAFIIADAPFQNWHSAIFERAERDYGNGINFLAPGVMQMVNWRAGVNYEEASVLNLADQIEEPVLLIHSEADQATGYIQSVNISRKLNSNSSFHLTKWGNKHVMDVINNKEEFTQLVNNFLKKEKLFQYDSAGT
ncbi:MAG: alpha/beta hydrolase [Ekhidna sp.]